MSRKNLPNIPIYIGDWERDCNVLSLEAEAAWMRIVFKLWTKGKQNAIKIPTKSLQNLWRCSFSEMHEILDELIYNDIAEIKVSEQFIEFTCRRFVKENQISKIRSKASKGKQKANKTQSNHNQNTDIDNENDNEIKDENETFEKSEKLLQIEVDADTLLEISKLKTQIQNEFSWKETICRNIREVIPKFTPEDFDNYLDQFFKIIKGDGEEYKTVQDTKKHFNRWLKIEIEKNNGKSFNDNQSGASKGFREKTAARLGIVQS